MYKSFAYSEKVKSLVLPLSKNCEDRWERNYFTGEGTSFSLVDVNFTKLLSNLIWLTGQQIPITWTKVIHQNLTLHTNNWSSLTDKSAERHSC